MFQNALECEKGRYHKRFSFIAITLHLFLVFSQMVPHWRKVNACNRYRCGFVTKAIPNA
jgi:hypothetical protein